MKKYLYELTGKEIDRICKKKTECNSCKLGYFINGHILCAKDIIVGSNGLKSLFKYLLQEIEV